MSSNLAEILTETAAEHGDRPALKLDDTVVTLRAARRRLRARRGMLRDKGVEPGDRVGIMLPNVPYFGGHLLRDPARGRRRRADEPAAQGPRGDVLPRGPGREGAVRLGRLRGGRAPGRRGGRRGARARQARRVRGARRRLRARRPTSPSARTTTPPSCSTRQAPPARPKGAELTHANLRKNCEISARTLARRARRTSCSARCRCSTPSGRRAGSTARSRVGACLSHDPALRPRQGAGDHRARQGHDLPGRADDVPRDAQPRRRARTPTCPRLRACMSGGAAMPVEVMKRVRGGVRLRGARGLRPLARPRRSPRSTSPARSASRARSARRSRASR